MKLIDAPRYFITLWWVHVGFDFYKTLYDFYIKVDPKTVPRVLKIREFTRHFESSFLGNFTAGEISQHDRQMEEGILQFQEFLESKGLHGTFTFLDRYKCKNGEDLPPNAHQKVVWEIKKTPEYVIQVQFYTGVDDFFVCMIKFFVVFL